MVSTTEKKLIVETTPWDLLTEERLNAAECYSGIVLKAFRVAKGWNLNLLACQLGIRRVSALRRLENTDRIGIKRAKELAIIFKVPNYRIFRDRAVLDQYRPSTEATEVLNSITEVLKQDGINVMSKTHSLTEDGKEAIKLVVRTKKRKFPEEIDGVSLIVEK